MANVFIFPGLNSLLKPSSRSWFKDYPEVLEHFSIAEKILKKHYGYQDTFLNFLDKPIDEIYEPHNIGLAAVIICSVQVAIYKILINKIGEPDWVMGCSLGDIARNVCSGSFSFETTVEEHFKFTQGIEGIDKIGGNISLVTTDGSSFTDEDFNWFEDIEVDASKLTPRILNIGGLFKDLKKIKDKAEVNNWAAQDLVNYPVHCRHILPIVADSGYDINKITAQAPHIKVFSSVLNKPLETESEIREESILGVIKPIHWHESVFNLIKNHNVDTFVNIGPCRSLSMIMRDLRLPNNIRVLEAKRLIT